MKSSVHVATFIYFITRPLFSILFAFLIVISLKAEYTLVSSVPDNLDPERFMYLCCFLSAVAGFFAGDFIDFLESKKFFRGGN